MRSLKGSFTTHTQCWKSEPQKHSQKRNKGLEKANSFRSQHAVQVGRSRTGGWRLVQNKDIFNENSVDIYSDGAMNTACQYHPFLNYKGSFFFGQNLDEDMREIPYNTENTLVSSRKSKWRMLHGKYWISQLSTFCFSGSTHPSHFCSWALGFGVHVQVYHCTCHVHPDNDNCQCAQMYAIISGTADQQRNNSQTSKYTQLWYKCAGCINKRE